MRSRKWVLFGVGLAFVFVCCLAVLLKNGGSLKSGANARIAVRYAYGLIKDGATSTIYFEPKSGQAITVKLWQDSYHHPIITIPCSDANVLLCLYDNDTSMRLLRIDSNKKFQPFSPKSALGDIVLSASCEVKYGTTNDWAEAISYIKGLPSSEFKRQSVPTVSLGIFRLHGVRQWILDRIEDTTIILPEQ